MSNFFFNIKSYFKDNKIILKWYDGFSFWPICLEIEKLSFRDTIKRFKIPNYTM